MLVYQRVTGLISYWETSILVFPPPPLEVSYLRDEDQSHSGKRMMRCPTSLRATTSKTMNHLQSDRRATRFTRFSKQYCTAANLSLCCYPLSFGAQRCSKNGLFFCMSKQRQQGLPSVPSRHQPNFGRSFSNIFVRCPFANSHIP